MFTKRVYKREESVPKIIIFHIWFFQVSSFGQVKKNEVALCVRLALCALGCWWVF
jgi:hypothetical protein